MSPSFAIRYELSISAADVGARVSVRRRLGEGLLGDVLGELTDWSDGALTVRRKDGTSVRIAEADLVAGKVIPARRMIARRHDLVSDADLQEVAALGWQGLETQRVGGWLLRAGGGFTGRANSALPIGDPGVEVGAAIDTVATWYHERDLRPMFQVPVPLAADLDAELDERGWDCRPCGIGGIHVMTADLGQPLEMSSAVVDLPPVVLAPEPSPGWLDVYRSRGRGLPSVAVDILRKAAAPVFAEISLDGQVVAIGRGVVDAGWLGIFAMETVDGARRRGLARHIVLSLIEHASRAGARHVYLQVEASNSGAIALYSGLGLTVHHSYHYRALLPEAS